MTTGPREVPQGGESGAPDGLSDEALASRYLGAPNSDAGRRSIETLLSRYDARVYHWCLRIAGNHDVALDLAQEAMLTALRDLEQFEGRARFASWLFTVVRRRCLRLLQRERRLLATDLDDETLPAATPDPADEAGDRDEEEWLRRTMAIELDPGEAAALLLRCDEGLPVEEITRMLRIEGASGARGVIQSARRKLRRALDRRRREEGEPR